MVRYAPDRMLAQYVSGLGHLMLWVPYCVQGYRDQSSKVIVNRQIVNIAERLSKQGGCGLYLHQQCAWQVTYAQRYSGGDFSTGLFPVFDFAKVHAGCPLWADHDRSRRVSTTCSGQRAHQTGLKSEAWRRRRMSLVSDSQLQRGAVPIAATNHLSARAVPAWHVDVLRKLDVNTYKVISRVACVYIGLANC